MLGPTGRNFGAGMSGGLAYVLDLIPTRVNRELVDVLPLRDADASQVQALLRRHAEVTGSAVASAVLDDWPATRERFSLVLPRAYQRVLDVRAAAQAKGWDLDGSQVWEQIMEASRG